MTTQFSKYDRSIFNALPSVELADERMRSSGALELAIRVLAPVVIRYDLHRTWGICILHNHWFLEDLELPIQSPNNSDNRCEYVTTPRSMEFSGSFWPSVIAVNEDCSPRPLEFSTTTEVDFANRELFLNPKAYA